MNKFISISGIDGAGKTTQISLLGSWICKKYGLKLYSTYEKLNLRNYSNKKELELILHEMLEADVIILRPYINSKETKQLQKEVLYSDCFNNEKIGKKLAELKERDIRLWFDVIVKKLLEKNKIVLFDRYYYDEICYRSLYFKDVDYYRELYKDYPSPIFKFYIDEKIKTLQIRNQNRSDGETKLFNNSSMLKKLKNNFKEIASKENIEIIRDSLTIEEKFSKIIEKIENSKKELLENE